MQDAVGVLLDVVVGVLVVLTQAVHHLHGRRVVQSHPKRVRLVLIEASSRSVTLRHVDVGCHLQPLKELGVDVSFYRVTFKFRISHYSFVTQVATRNVELCILTTLRDSHLIVLCNTGTEQLVHPVDTWVGAAQVGLHSRLVNSLILYQGLCIFLGAHHLGDVVGVAQAESSIHNHLSGAHLTALGRNQYYTISTTATVDGC